MRDTNYIRSKNIGYDPSSLIVFMFSDSIPMQKTFFQNTNMVDIVDIMDILDMATC